MLMEIKRELVFATNNAHKISEAQAIVDGKIRLISLASASINIEVEETGSTFFENAYLKAKAIYEATGKACVADDSGLCVDCLDGAPGVYSSRYAGEPVNHQKNNEKLLREMSVTLNRKAHFKTVLCVIGLESERTQNSDPMKPLQFNFLADERAHVLFFEGVVDGEIAPSPCGVDGFGYDPLFVPMGYDITFAQMLAHQKNALSHRGKAFESLLQYIGNGVPALAVVDFDYDLPSSRIAFEAIEPRDASKLLVFNDDGMRNLSDLQFHELPVTLQSGDLLVVNDTKVIPARLMGMSQSGSAIEVFLLNPLDTSWSFWEAMVGHRKKLKVNESVVVDDGFGKQMLIEWHDRDKNLVKLLKPEGFDNLQDAISHFGQVPLPPYIERAVTVADKERYQAIFADKVGAVAAPTASLHFTEELKNNLIGMGVELGAVTLHVGAGTFKPMSAKLSSQHDMHAERFELSVEFMDVLINGMGSGRRIVGVGTTSMRVLESIYFIGCRIIKEQWDGMVYSGDGYNEGLKLLNGIEISLGDAMRAVRENAVFVGGVIHGQTQIFIVNGFRFRLIDGLITNFHQPKSTLLMLVSAFLGPGWRHLYDYAMENNYRFLSYGDGSLLWR